MKNVLVGIVALAGLATVASAATTVQYQVRTLGGTWSSSLDVLPGTSVEFRALVSHSGTLSITDAFGDTYTGPAAGLAGVNTQPMISNWNPGSDSLGAFLTSGSAINSSVLDFDAPGASYGRRNLSIGNAGILAGNALRGHTTNVVAGVRYLRIAQNNTTNFPGAGTGTNNLNGAAGVPVSQTGPNSNANYNGQTEGVEIQRFLITVGGPDMRSLTVSTALEAFGQTSTGARRVQWHVAGAPTDVPADDTQISVLGATINVVPTPGALALLGMGGLIAGRRRRA